MIQLERLLIPHLLPLEDLATYGVLSIAVEGRTQEMGIRLALGADRSDVGQQVHGDHRQADVFQVDLEPVIHHDGEPEQVEPPDGIAEEFGAGKAPRLSEPQRGRPHGCR